MHLSRYFPFLLLGSCFALTGEPALADTSAVQSATTVAKHQSTRKPRQFRPPLRSSRNEEDLPPQVDGRSAGSRGCMIETVAETASQAVQDRLPALMLLAPLDSVAQTQSTQPLLAWYLRDSSFNPFIFRLYEVEDGLSPDGLNDPKQSWTLLSEVALPAKDKSVAASGQNLAAAKAGISILKLSALPQPPKLRVGGHYVWQVELFCDPERPSRNLFAQAALKVVAPSGQTRAQPSLSQSKTTILTELLEQGLWQDALAFSLENSKTSLHSSAQIILDSVVLDDGELEALQQATVHH